MREVLFIDDQLDSWLDILQAKLKRWDWHVIGEENPGQALARIKEMSPDAVLLDIMFPDGDSMINLGKPTLYSIRKKYPSLPVVMLTSTLADAGLEVDPDDFNAADYIFSKDGLSLASDDFDPFEELAKQLNRACSRAEEVQPLDERLGFIVGETIKMQQVAKEILKIAPLDSTVLIRGESGTGKELISKAIHENSPRADGPFIKLNCAALSNDLLESELFGHEKGSFTGAVSQRKGRFEQANSGSIFLDEIGEISPAFQTKLLRVLQEGEFERVGGTKTIRVDVRVIAATHFNLEQGAKEGKFREDLYYRLNVTPIFIPALRERKSDILVLFNHFVLKKNQELGLSILPVLREDVATMLKAHDWPGNIREFENAIHAAMAKANASILTLGAFAHFGQEEQAELGLVSNDIVKDILNGRSDWGVLKNIKGEMRKSILVGLIEQIKENDGKRPGSAELASLLGISDDNMRRVIRDAGLSLREFD